MTDADAGELYAAWRGAEARIDELENAVRGLAERIAAIRHVLDVHGPDGMYSAGYDLWADVYDALREDTQDLTPNQEPSRESERA